MGLTSLMSCSLSNFSCSLGLIGSADEDADPQYWKDNYGMGIHTARLTAAMADKVYRPRLKGISPGKVIAQTETTARITCSATRGSSGSPVSHPKTPLAVTMMHFRAKREYQDNEEVFSSNLALKMNAPGYPALCKAHRYWPVGALGRPGLAAKAQGLHEKQVTELFA
jgi:hypothetical protein